MAVAMIERPSWPYQPARDTISRAATCLIEHSQIRGPPKRPSVRWRGCYVTPAAACSWAEAC